jgi:hypothetical protein
MPNRAAPLNASVELAEEIFVVELQHIKTVRRGLNYYQAVSHWEEYGEDFYDLEDAKEHVQFEIEHDEELYASRIKRRLVQRIEVIAHEWDRNE